MYIKGINIVEEDRFYMFSASTKDITRNDMLDGIKIFADENNFRIDVISFQPLLENGGLKLELSARVKITPL